MSEGVPIKPVDTFDGKPYRNTYAWFMKLRDRKIVNVTAFFDSITFDEFWRRVPPRKK